MSSFELYVTGDPIVDIWIEGRGINTDRPRFVTSKRTTRGGGALNTYNNCRDLLSNHPSISVDTGWLSTITPCKLTRLIDIDTGLGTEFWNHEDTINMYLREIPLFMPTKWQPKGLVISEYNKGMCSQHKQDQGKLYGGTFDESWKFLVVDSRYRTCASALIQGFPGIKIWHATAGEYDNDWAQQFDYVFHTNAEKQVWMFDPKEDLNSIKSSRVCLPVPDTKAVDTVGAGDTFTAAIATYLAAHWEAGINRPLLIKAGEFAIDCCQEVIQQKYTAVTTKKVPPME